MCSSNSAIIMEAIDLGELVKLRIGYRNVSILVTKYIYCIKIKTSQKSKIIPVQVYYCKCCYLVGVSIRYLFLDKMLVATS